MLGAILGLHHGGEVEANAIDLYFGERGIGRRAGRFKAHEAHHVEVEDLARAQMLAGGWGEAGGLEVELD